MNKIKSTLTLLVLTGIAGTGFGCLLGEGHGRRIHEPSGSPRDYRYENGYDDGHRYDHDGYYNRDRYDERHQWDNPNYRR